VSIVVGDVESSGECATCKKGGYEKVGEGMHFGHLCLVCTVCLDFGDVEVRGGKERYLLMRVFKF
jgi:hypothetical protein